MHTFVDPFLHSLHFFFIIDFFYGVNLIRYAYYYIPCEQSGNRTWEYLKSQPFPPKSVTRSFLTPFSFNFSCAVSVKSSLALSQQ